MVTTTVTAVVLALAACGTDGATAEGSTAEPELSNGVEITTSQPEWSLSDADALIDVTWTATFDGEPVNHDNCAGFYSEHSPGPRVIETTPLYGACSGSGEIRLSSTDPLLRPGEYRATVRIGFASAHAVVTITP